MFERYEECLKGRHLVGDPVDVVTGANTDIKFDFELPGPLPLRWRRYYSSARNTVACPLGWGHSHELDHTIDRDLDGLIYVDPLGTVVEFPELSEDGEEAIAGGFLLRRLAARLFEIEQSDGPTRVFKIPAAGPAQLVALRQDEHAIKLQRSVTGRLEWIIDSRGVRTRVATDHAGRVTGLYLNEHADKRRELPLMLYRYDEAGNLVAARDGHGATLRFQYDPNNRMTRWTDRLGYSFHFEYDFEGRCVHTFGDDGLLEVFLEYYPVQKCTIVRHADGGVWTYYYNDVGSLTEIRAPDCGTTRFNFDESGRVIEEVDPNGNVTKLLYDELGRHSLRVDPLGYVHPPAEGKPDRYNPSEYTLPQTPLEWEYGKLLDPAQISARPQDEPSLDHLLFTSNGNDQGNGKSNGNGNAHKRRERRKFDFNRNLIEHQDRDGVVYRRTYKSWNMPHRWIDHHGGTTVMEYSSDARLTRLADAGGTISEYAYNAKKRLVEVRRQGRVRDRYAYDQADNLVEKRDEDSRLLLRFEIGRGNLSKARHLSSGGTHEFRRDAYGRIISARIPAGETTRSYDDDGQLLSDEVDGLGVVHRFALGSIAESVYLGKFAVRYDHEEDGTLLIVDPTGGDHRLRLDGHGRVSLILENGSTLESRYDDKGKCLAKTRSSGPSGSAAWSRTFEYSAEGDLLTATDSTKGTTRYEHSGHRLIREIQPDQTRHDYRYNAAGNLLEQPGLAGVRIAEANRLAVASGDQFFYNNRGHICRRQSWCGETTYDYDSLDMLTRCMIDGQEWTAAYDAFCRRTCKTWQGRTTRYYWDHFRLSSEIRHDGTVRLYLYVDEAALVPFQFIEYDGLDADPASGRRYYVFTNQVGAPVRVEDDHGEVAWSAEISPYGQARVAEGSRIDLSLRFPGHYHDPELDLHYNRFRYYSPELGRYIQSDPLGIAGGINLYAYAPEPTTTVDIDGLSECGPGHNSPADTTDDGISIESSDVESDSDDEDWTPPPPQDHFRTAIAQPRDARNDLEAFTRDWDVQSTHRLETPFGWITVCRGQGGQPYVRTRNADYGTDHEPQSYDDLRNAISDQHGNVEQARALLLLLAANGATRNNLAPEDIARIDAMPGNVRRAMATLHGTANVAESHSTRTPESAPLYRAGLGNIVAGTHTFADVFNRNDGTFVPAHFGGTGEMRDVMNGDIDPDDDIAGLVSEGSESNDQDTESDEGMVGTSAQIFGNGSPLSSIGSPQSSTDDEDESVDPADTSDDDMSTEPSVASDDSNDLTWTP